MFDAFKTIYRYRIYYEFAYNSMIYIFLISVSEEI